MTKQTRRSTVALTGGNWRGRKLQTPGGATHPMGERERLALFNSLTGLMEFGPEMQVLDVFAGSGALGLEAMSRGAGRATFVERAEGACRMIRENAATLGAEVVVLCMGVEKFARETRERFELILMDPPYDDYKPEMVATVGALLADGGILVVSHPAEMPTEDEIAGLEMLKSRKYAGATITFYRRAD